MRLLRLRKVAKLPEGIRGGLRLALGTRGRERGLSIRRARPVLALASSLALLAGLSCHRPASVPQGSSVRETPRGDITRFVLEHLAAFERGDFIAWADGMAPDVFLIATDPQGALLGREAVLAEMHRHFDPTFGQGLHLSIQSKSMHIGLARDGLTAWTANDLAYTLAFAGDTLELDLRTTLLLTKQAGQWLVLVAHYSLAVPGDELRHGLQEGRYPSPAKVGESIAPEASDLAQQFRKDLGRRFNIGLGRDPFAVGPEPEDLASEPKKVKRLLRQAVDRYGTPEIQPEGTRAALAPGGEIGWVAANLGSETQLAGKTVKVPLRAVAIYLQEGRDWKLTQVHVSVGVPDPLSDGCGDAH